MLINYHFLGDVNQLSGEITRISRFQSSISQTFSGTMSGNKILQDVQPFSQIGSNRRFNDFSRRFAHQASDCGQLPDLLFITSGTGVSHDIKWIQPLFFKADLPHRLHHGVSNFFCNRGPDLYHPVESLSRGDGSFPIKFFYLRNFLFRLFDDIWLFGWNHKILYAQRKASFSGIVKTKLLELVQHLSGFAQSRLQINIIDQIFQTFSLK